MTKKISVAFILFLLGVSFLSAQSLAEASKKERARRAALKGTQTVVTNEDLGKLKKKAAMTESVPENPAEEAVVDEAEGTVPPGGEEAQAQPTEQGEAPPAAVETPPEAAPPSAQTEPALNQEEFGRRKAELEDVWNKAQELVDLLTMKMNGLWQEFYNLDDMTARDKIQQQISETYEKLLKTQQDATKAREELDTFIALTPRENVPQIWIR